MSAVIVDYGMCNLGSVRRAFEECGADALLTDNPDDLEKSDHIILPGVGAFAKGMENLRERGWIEPLNRAVLEKKIPILGICLGMQLLADRGEEGGETKGLGYIRGSVLRLKAPANERIPHVGWNDIHPAKASALFESIA